MKRVLSLVPLVLAPCILKASEVALSIDFDDSPLNGKPLLAVVEATDDRQVVVTEATSVPGHPFGLDAGYVLALEKGGSHKEIPRATWNFSGTPEWRVKSKSLRQGRGRFHYGTSERPRAAFTIEISGKALTPEGDNSY